MTFCFNRREFKPFRPGKGLDPSMERRFGYIRIIIADGAFFVESEGKLFQRPNTSSLA